MRRLAISPRFSKRTTSDVGMRGVARRPLQPPGYSSSPKAPSRRLRRLCQRSQSLADRPDARRCSSRIYSRNVASESLIARGFFCIARSGIGLLRCQVDGSASEFSNPVGCFPSGMEISDQHGDRPDSSSRWLRLVDSHVAWDPQSATDSTKVESMHSTSAFEQTAQPEEHGQDTHSGPDEGQRSDDAEDHDAHQ
jgi:hypothetical protein